MEEHAAKQTRYAKNVPCPGCGQLLEMELVFSLIEGELYAWYEGLCKDCLHKVVDPLPKLKTELTETGWKILSN